jgi:hypothetical protein
MRWLVVAAPALPVVLLAGFGVVLAAGHDGPGDADQGVGDGDRVSGFIPRRPATAVIAAYSVG